MSSDSTPSPQEGFSCTKVGLEQHIYLRNSLAFMCHPGREVEQVTCSIHMTLIDNTNSLRPEHSHYERNIVVCISTSSYYQSVWNESQVGRALKALTYIPLTESSDAMITRYIWLQRKFLCHQPLSVSAIAGTDSSGSRNDASKFVDQILRKSRA